MSYRLTPRMSMTSLRLIMGFFERISMMVREEHQDLYYILMQICVTSIPRQQLLLLLLSSVGVAVVI